MIDTEIQLEDDRATGVKYVSGSEPFVLGHYPGNPLFPGVLSVELILEVAAFLVRQRFGGSFQPAGLKKVQFLDLARQNGALTVAVTGARDSALARAADERLITHARESALRAGAMVSRIAQLALVDCLFLGVARLRYEQTIDALKRTRDVTHPQS